MLEGRQRIMVVGSGGAGKSTFSRELARLTGLPLVYLDVEYWKPGWVPTPREVWRERVTELASADRWIMDGNYSGTLALRLERCDAAVFFDFPRLVCLHGVIKRWAKYRLGKRPDVPDGCPENLDLEFLTWIWNYPRDSRPRILEGLEHASPDTAVATVRSRKDTKAILDGLRTG